ncbi:hypothetical protein PND94_06300, partial [Flavonifractor plautii]|nr:hypothetical protein [Flavonifractor plautii]MDB7945648.1 hypothetical protein [Flavonifractor plautii]
VSQLHSTRHLQTMSLCLFAKLILPDQLRKARDEAQELLIVKANVDRILQNTERGGNAQEKGTVSFAANCALY